MQYISINDIVRAIKDSDRDLQVVLMPGNERVSIWPKGHPCGFAEDHHASITVPAGLNGNAAEYLREELNARNGWAVTGDEMPEPLDVRADFAVQLEFELTQPESLKHIVWTELHDTGPITSRDFAERTGRALMQVQKTLSILSVEGYAECVMLDGRTGMFRATDKEPSYSVNPHRSDEIGQLEVDDFDRLMALLDEKPMSLSEMIAATGWHTKKLRKMVRVMQKHGVAECVGTAYRRKWKIIS